MPERLYDVKIDIHSIFGVQICFLHWKKPLFCALQESRNLRLVLWNNYSSLGKANELVSWSVFLMAESLDRPVVVISAELSMVEILHKPELLN